MDFSSFVIFFLVYFRLKGRFYLKTNDDHQKSFAKGRKGIRDVILAAKRNTKKHGRFNQLRSGFKSFLNNTLKRIHRL